MTVPQRTYAALVVLAIGSGGLYLSQRRERAQAVEHSASAHLAALPSLGLVPADAGRISKLELAVPAQDDAPAQDVTLQRRGEDWRISAPIDSAASLSKVQALLDNLSNLKLSDSVDSGAGYYVPYGLTEAAAFHLLAWRGADRVIDLYFGKSSARGQFVRFADRPGVFTVDSSGPTSYSGFLYTRPLRSWRETAIFQFDPALASAIQIENRFGRFLFSSTSGSWSCLRSERSRAGALGVDKPWPECDAGKVRSLLNAFKSLSADEFGREADRAGSGIDQAEHSGGVIRITLRDPERELSLRVGNLASGGSGWSIKDSRWAVNASGDSTLYALALWTTGWVTSDATQFETPHQAATARSARNVEVDRQAQAKAAQF